MFAQAAKEQDLELIVNMSHIQSRPYARSKATQNHWLSEQIFDWSGVPTTHSADHVLHAVAALRLRADPPWPLRHAL